MGCAAAIMQPRIGFRRASRCFSARPAIAAGELLGVEFMPFDGKAAKLADRPGEAGADQSVSGRRSSGDALSGGAAPDAVADDEPRFRRRRRRLGRIIRGLRHCRGADEGKSDEGGAEHLVAFRLVVERNPYLCQLLFATEKIKS